MSLKRHRTAFFLGLLLILVAFSGRDLSVRANETIEQSPAAKETDGSAEIEAGRSDVNSEPAAQTSRVTGRAGFFERLPPRPILSEDELREKSLQLRDSYSKSVQEWPAPHLDADVKWLELGLLPKVQHPDSNPMTPEKVLLGKILFFDPRISKTGEMSCASCHDPDLAWADGRTTSFGLGRAELKRNAPSIMNVAHLEHYFWDGRAGTLEDQALHVLANQEEMAISEDVIIHRLTPLPLYQVGFEKVFGDPTVNLERISEALACFQRTIVGGRSRFDSFLKGKHDALSDSEVRGLDVFRTAGRCLNCHSGPTLSDHQFHDIGLSYYGRKFEDIGRYSVTNESTDMGRFRTPSLRNISNTRPYMHNGLFELPNVLRMYNAGMPTLVPREHQKDDPLFPVKSPLLKPLGLNSQDLEDLENFLISLTEPKLRVRPPSFKELDSTEAALKLFASLRSKPDEPVSGSEE